MIPIAKIERDRALQSRAEMDVDQCRDYGARYKARLPMPPIKAIRDAHGKIWVWDGWHRIEGCLLEGIKQIEAEITEGTRRDAVLLAAGANKAHGVHRTREDKRHCVRILLEDPEWRRWSNVAIAEHCGVSDRFVALMKEEWETADAERIIERSMIDEAATVTVERRGTVYEMAKKPRLTLAEDPKPPKKEPEFDVIEWLPPPIERAINKLAKWTAKMGHADEAAEPLAVLRRLSVVQKKKLAKGR